MKINEIITEGPPKGSPFFSAEPRINKQWDGKEFTPKQYAHDKAEKIRMKAVVDGGEPRKNPLTPRQAAGMKKWEKQMNRYDIAKKKSLAKMPKLSDIKIKPVNYYNHGQSWDPKLNKPLLTRGAGGGPRDWRAEDGPYGKGPRAKLTPLAQELIRNQDIKMGRNKGMRSLGGKLRSLGGKFGGTLGILPALTGIPAARKRAKEYTGKDDPSFMDTMKTMYPVLGKPKKKFGLNPGDA